MSQMPREIVRLRHSRRAPAFTLVELLVVIAIIGVLVALLLPAVQAAREAARRAQCMNNFKQIGLAMQNHHSAKGAFPSGINMWNGFGCATPATGPFQDYHGWGWATFILPYLEQANAYDQFDFDLPGQYGAVKNIAAGQTFIEAYLCPSDDQSGELMNCCSHVPGPDLAGTSAAGVADSTDWTCDGAWPKPDPPRNPVQQGANGVLFQRSEISTKHITDGTSNTLLVGEVIGAGAGTNQGPFWVTWNVQHTGNGLNLPLQLDPKPSFWNVDESGFASYHPGGAHFALASGTVRFINDTVDQYVLEALATRAGAEVVE